MNRFELTYKADKILAGIPRVPDQPHYVEDTFKRKLKLAQQRESNSKVVYPQESNLQLLESEYRAIFRRAKLTARQREVVELRIMGITYEEIGRRSNCTKQGVLNILRQASKKIGGALDVYPYAGLTEVYRAELRKGLSGGRGGRLIG